MFFYLIDIDLLFLRGVGVVFLEFCVVNFVGVKVYCRFGDKVYICVWCNFLIVVYGRLV